VTYSSSALLEAFEFAQHKITEVGIVTLDTRDLVALPPGSSASSASAWLDKIKSRHIHVKENRHLVNRKFVKGCPDKFNFGSSEIMDISTIGNLLSNIFRESNMDASSEMYSPGDTGQTGQKEQRNTILVGHDIRSDIKYLQRFKFVPTEHANIIKTFDTQVLCGTTKKYTIGLEKLCRILGLAPSNLHNAGNDAMYTLQAMVVMAVRDAEEAGSVARAVAATRPPEPTAEEAMALRIAKEERREAKRKRREAQMAELAKEVEGR